jgi:hypothetical protein
VDWLVAMISFEERYYHSFSPSSRHLPATLAPSYSSSLLSNSSSLNINSITKLRSPNESESALLLIGYENKITWAELYENEICTREVLLSLPVSYEINGLWSISVRNKSLLYISILTTDQRRDQTTTTTTSSLLHPLNPPPHSCHLLGYEFISSSSPSSSFALKQFQELKLCYDLLDLKEFIFEGKPFLGCLGNDDQRIHVYEIDHHGVLHRKGKRANRARAHLNSRVCQGLTPALALRFVFEDWSEGGGSQCLFGYLDGHLHWDRQEEVMVMAQQEMKGNDKEELIEQKKEEKEQEQEEERGEGGGEGKEEDHQETSNQNRDEKPSATTSSPPSVLSQSSSSPKEIQTESEEDKIDSADFPLPPLHISPPLSPLFSRAPPDLLTIAEGSDEDEEFPPPKSSNHRPHRSPYTQNTPSQKTLPRERLHENAWDDLIESDCGTSVRCPSSLPPRDTKLSKLFSRVFQHYSIQSIVPHQTVPLPAPSSSTSSLPPVMVIKKYSYSYLLSGSLSCIQFYQREAHAVRAFRHKYSTPAGPSSFCASSTHPSLPKTDLLSPSSPSQPAATPAASASSVKWKEPLKGRVREPSSCVLIGSSEGKLALLSLERKIVPEEDEYPTPSSALSRSTPAWCWEEGDEEGESYQMKSIFINSSSKSWGNILCVCVADVTGNGLNDVIVGYDTGLVRILSILETSSSSDQSCGAENNLRSHSQSYDYDLPDDGLMSHRSSFIGGGGGSGPSPPQRASCPCPTLNSECWSLTHSSFNEICQLQLPFPVMAIDYGQLLGPSSSTSSPSLPSPRQQQTLLMNQLLIVTTKSLHVWVPCQKSASISSVLTATSSTSGGPITNRNSRSGSLCEGLPPLSSPLGVDLQMVIERTNEETIESLEEKKTLILQILNQLDEQAKLESMTES